MDLHREGSRSGGLADLLQEVRGGAAPLAGGADQGCDGVDEGIERRRRVEGGAHLGVGAAEGGGGGDGPGKGAGMTRRSGDVGRGRG